MFVLNRGFVMKRYILGVAVLGLSACGWNNSGHNGYNYGNQYNQNSGYYGGNQGYHQGYHQGHQQPGQHFKHRQGGTSLEFGVGVEEFTGGNLLPREPFGNGSLNKIEYDDAYDTAYRFSGGIAHDVAPKTTLLARGFYKHADSSGDVLDVAQDANGATTAAGTFSDYKSYGAEIGFREYLNARGAKSQLRPYIGATVGAAYLESIDFNSVTGNSAQLFDGEWVPTASALVGIELPVSKQFSLGVESGLRYEGNREVADGPYDTTDAYSIPVQLRGRFRF